MLRKRVHLISLAVLLTSAFVVDTSADGHKRGLLEVEQIIFGMDCAPCAYGVEKGLKRLPGVLSVEVSLNDGNVIVDFAAGSPVSLEDVRETIRRNGFTPKDAKVRIVGELRDVSGSLFLVIDSESRYELSGEQLGIREMLETLREGDKVELIGYVPEATSQTSQLYVAEIILPD